LQFTQARDYYRSLAFDATPVLNYRELSEVYQLACGAEGTACNDSIDVVFEVPGPNQRGLVNAMSLKFGPADPAVQTFELSGDEYGVSHSTTP
jgi:hypothetical protein